MRGLRAAAALLAAGLAGWWAGAAGPVREAPSEASRAYFAAARELPSLIARKGRPLENRLLAWAKKPETAARAARIAAQAGGAPSLGADAFSQMVRLHRLAAGEPFPQADSALLALVREKPGHFFWVGSFREELSAGQRHDLLLALRNLPPTWENPYLALARWDLEGRKGKPAAARLTEIPADVRLVDCRKEWGRILYLQGDIAAALDVWRRLGEISAREGDDWLTVELLTLSAQGNVSEGRLDEAQQDIYRARRILRGFPVPCLETRVEFARGMLLAQRGRVRDAILAFRGILQRSGPDLSPLMRNALQVNLAYLYDENGEYGRALSAYEEAIAASPRSMSPRSRATNLLDRGALYERLGMLEHARADYEGVLDIAGGQTLGEMRALAFLNLGNLFSCNEMWDSASSCHEEARNLFQSLGRDEELLLLGLNRVEACLRRGRLKEAAGELQALQGGLRKHGTPQLRSMFLYFRCRLALSAGKADNAERSLSELCAALPDGTIGPLQWEVPLLRAQVHALRREFAAALEDFAAARKAFDAMQNCCGSEEPRISFGATGRDLVEAMLDTLLAARGVALAGDPWLQATLDAMEWYRCRVLRKRLEAENGRSQASGRVGLPEVRDLLSRRDATALCFFQGGRDLYYLFLNGRGEAGALAGLVRPAAPEDASETPDGAEQGRLRWEAPLERLFSSPGPLAMLASCSEVIVLPDGDLFRFPLERLSLGCGPGKTWLGLWKPVVNLPSWRLHFRERPGSGSCFREYCGIVGRGGPGNRRADLPHAWEEVAGAARDFPWRSPMVLHAPAFSEAAVRLGGLHAKVFHVASHIEADGENPWKSRIVLGPGENEWTLGDLEGLRLHADLVVLSGCRSGAGKVFPGEGNISLARSFLYTGCGGVLTTEEAVEDRFACLFVRQFFRRLRESGGDAVRALHRTRVDFGSDPAYGDPDLWSNFRLYGIPAPIQPEAPLPPAGVWAALAFFFGTPALARWANRNRKP